MAGNTVEVNIIGRESVSGEIAKVIAALNALKDKTVKVNLDVDRKALNNNINDAVRGYNNNPATRRLQLDVDRRHLQKDLNDAVKDLTGKARKVTVEVDIDTKNAVGKLAALKALIKDLSANEVNVDVDVNTGQGIAKLAALQAAIKAVTGKTVDVNVRGNTTGFNSDVDKVTKKVKRDEQRNPVEIPVVANTDEARKNVRELKDDTDALYDSIRRGRDSDLIGDRRYRDAVNKLETLSERYRRLNRTSLGDNFDGDKLKGMLADADRLRSIIGDIGDSEPLDRGMRAQIARQRQLDDLSRRVNERMRDSLGDSDLNTRIRLNFIIDQDRVNDQIQNLSNTASDRVNTVRIRTELIPDTVDNRVLQRTLGIDRGNEVINRYIRERIHIDEEIVGGGTSSRGLGRLTDGFRNLRGSVDDYISSRRQLMRNTGNSRFDNAIVSGMRRLDDALGINGGRGTLFHNAARGASMFTNALSGMTSRIPVLRGVFSGLNRLTQGFTQLGRSGGALGALGKALGPIGAIASGLAAVYSVVQVMGAVGVIGTSALAAGLLVANGAMAVGIGLASGLAGVVGGALAGGLIAVAAQAPEVQEAFSKLGTHVTDTMKDVTKNLIPALVDMAPKLQSAFDQVTPSLRRMSQGTEQLMNDLSKDLPAIAAEVGPALESAFDTGSDHLKIMSRNMPALVSSVGKFFDHLDSPEVLQASETFWKRLPTWVERAGGAVETTAKAFNNLDSFLTGEQTAPFREGFSNFFREMSNTDWSKTADATAGALNALGSFVQSIDGAQVDGIVSNVVEGFKSLTEAAESGGLMTFMEGLTGGFELFADSVKTAGGWIEDVMEHLNIGGRGDSADVMERTAQKIKGVKDAWNELNREDEIPGIGKLDDSLGNLNGSLENLKEISAEAGKDFEDRVVNPLTKLDPRNYNPDDLSKVIDSAAFTAEMIPKFDNMQIEKAATGVTATIQAEMEWGNLKGADLDAAIGTKNSVLEVAAEISGDNITSALDMLQGLEAAVKLRPDMTETGFQGMMEGLEIAAKVVPEIESRGDQIMWTAGIEATIPVMPKIEDLGGLGQTLQGISAAVEIIPKLEGAAQSDFIQGFTQSLGKITISAANMDFTGLQDGLNQMEAAINAARISLKLEPIDIPDLIPQNPQLPPVEPPAKPPEVPFVPKPPREWERDPAGNLISNGNAAEMPIDPTLQDPTQKFFNDPVPMPIQPDPVGLGAFDAMGQGMTPIEAQIIPKFDGAASFGAIPPMEVQILPKFDGAMNFGAIPPMEVQILPKFDGAMNFGAIPPMEVQILPKFDGAMNFGAIPPMEVQIIPKFDGAAAFGIIPPMEVQIIPKFDGAAAFGIIPPMEVQIIPKFDGAAAFGIIPPMEVQIIPKFDGAAALGMIPPIPVQIIPILGSALAIPAIPVPIIPQLQGGISIPPIPVPVIPQVQGGVTIPPATVQVTPSPNSITVPVQPSSHTIMIAASPSALTIPVSPSSHTISVSASPSSINIPVSFTMVGGIPGLPGGGGGKGKSMLSGLAGFSGLVGAAYASGASGVSTADISSAGQVAGEAYGKGFSKGADKEMSKGMKDAFEDLKKQGDKELAREEISKSLKGAPGGMIDLHGRPVYEDISIPRMSLKEEDEWFKLTGQYKDAKDRAEYLAYWGGWSMLTDEEIAMVKDGVQDAKKFDAEATKAADVMKDSGYTAGKLADVSNETLMKLAESWEGTKDIQNRDPRVVQAWQNRRENLQKELESRGLVDKWADSRKEEAKLITENANPKIPQIMPLGLDSAAPANQINEGARQVQEAWTNFGNAMNTALPGANIGGIINSIIPPDLANQLSQGIQAAANMVSTIIPPINLPLNVTPPPGGIIPPELMNMPPIVANIQTNAQQVVQDIQQIGQQFLQPHLTVLNNIPEVKAALEDLNGENTESTHTVNVDTKGEGGGGKPAGFGGFGTFAGFGGAGFATGFSGPSFSVNSNLYRSMILISDTIRSAISNSWLRAGIEAITSFATGLESTAFGTSFLSGFFGKLLGFLGFGGPTISVYEDGVLVSKSLAKGIRAGNKYIIKSLDDSVGDAVFTMPRPVFEPIEFEGLFGNGVSGVFEGLKFQFGNLLDFFTFRLQHMSAGYLNEYGQMVVYNTYDNSTHNNHFDGGLVGDPEKQAKRVLDVLENAHQGRRYKTVIGGQQA